MILFIIIAAVVIALNVIALIYLNLDLSKTRVNLAIKASQLKACKEDLKMEREKTQEMQKLIDEYSKVWRED